MQCGLLRQKVQCKRVGDEHVNKSREGTCYTSTELTVLLAADAVEQLSHGPRLNGL